MFESLIRNLFTPNSGVPRFGVGYAGTFNVESGFAQISTDHFGACAACEDQTEISRSCSSCGRRVGNNFRFLAGRGAGVYAGLSFEVGDDHMASMYVFDEDNTFASSLVPTLTSGSMAGNDFHQKLVDSTGQYWGAELAEVGRFSATWDEAANAGYLLADSEFHPSGKFAKVDHLMADGDFIVYLAMEPMVSKNSVAVALGSDPRSIDLGYKDAMRPRVAFILNAKYEKSVMAKVKTAKVRWDKQAEVWARTIVATNMAEPNGPTANLFNGLAWKATADDQWQAMLGLSDVSDETAYLWYLYATRSMGYLIAAAIGGDDNAPDLITEALEGSGGEDLLDPQAIDDALEPRGLAFTREVGLLMGFAAESSGAGSPVATAGQNASFCGSCGVKFANDQKFCSECGTKR